MTNDTIRNDPASVERSARLRDRVPSPTLLVALGFLGIPSLVVPSLEWTEKFFLFFLFGLWPIAKFLVSSVGDENPTDWITMGTRSGLPTLVSFAYLQLNPFVQLVSLGQIAGVVPVLVRHRFDLPDAESYDQAVDYRLPIEGEWTVVSGGPTREHSHSWGILTQRYAYDLVVADERGCSHGGDGRSLTDYHCYSEPVLAPADGEVVAANDNHRDYHRSGGWLDPLQRDIRGNYIVIEHDGGEYTTLAHLQEGSIPVSVGDRVECGERVGRCGNSGNSTEPHLHVHVADRPSIVFGMGLPVTFSSVRVREGSPESGNGDAERNGTDAAAPTDERAYLRAGQRVAPAE
jgi:murein DD-endopeptidase MepM/ murein hydrolase activator NlpD